jgi:hypothetical protein
MIDPTVTVDPCATGATVGESVGVLGVAVGVPVSEVVGAVGVGPAWGEPPHPARPSSATRPTTTTRVLMSGS